MRNLFSWYFLLFAGNVCSVFLFILSQSVAVVHYEGALKRRVWLVSMCEATMCCEDVWDYHGSCEDVCDCGLCVKTVELVRIITAYLQMHLPWFLPNAQTRWLLTTMITHTTRNIAATKYWIRPIFFKTDHALPSEAWMMMKCQWKYQNCRSLHHTLPPLMFMAFPNSPQQPSSKEKMLAVEREDSRRDISRSEDG